MGVTDYGRVTSAIVVGLVSIHLPGHMGVTLRFTYASVAG